MMMFFNLPVKQLYFVYNQAIIFFASFINAASICYVLFFSLVLVHSISAPFDTSLKWFYLPKLLLILPVFVSIFLDHYWKKNGQKERF